MSSNRRLKFPDGPLTDAYVRLAVLYVPFGPHADAEDALMRLAMASGTAGSFKGLALIGNSGVGKTTVLKTFAQKLRVELKLSADAPSPFPIIGLTADVTPKSITSSTLKALGDPLHWKGTQNLMENRIEELAREAEIIGLGFDEFHHVYSSKSKSQASVAAETFKSIVNRVKLPIVVSGVHGIESFIANGPELVQRFQRKIYIEDPSISSVEDISGLRHVLAEMARILPSAEECRLDQQGMLVRLLVAGKGSFGSIVDMVKRACEIGALAQDPQVTMRHYEQAYFEFAGERRRNPTSPFKLPMDTVKTLAMQLGNRPRGKPTSGE